MKIKYLALATFLAASPLATAATPGSGWYVGGDVSLFNYDENSDIGTLNMNTLNVKAGYNINPYFAFETRLGVGVNDDSVYLSDDVIRLDMDVSVNHVLGVYGRGSWPVTEALSIYGLVGVSQVKLDIDVLLRDYQGYSERLSGSGKETGASFGIGAEFAIRPNWAVHAEYVRLLDESDFTIDALTLGATYRF